LSKILRWVKKASHRSTRVVVLFTRTKDIFRIRFVRLRVNRSFISKREWWFNQISNVFLKNVVLSWVQLWDLWQEIASNYSLFRTMTSWIAVSENIYQCANWSQKLEIFHDHEEIKQTLSEMSRIFCWIRL
jgi:hypothetical protein